MRWQHSALGNYVWNDLNANGIQDDGATGIAGATVNLYFDANNDGLINGAEATTPVATTLTNAMGFYSFPNLAAGVYQVGVVTPAGYDAASEPGNGTAATDSDADPVTGLSALVTLPLNTANNDIDAGYYQLGSIGNYVWSDTNGDGLQALGEPGIPGGTVS